jgi:hypothetical protein
MVSAGTVSCAPRSPIEPEAPRRLTHRISHEPRPYLSERTRASPHPNEPESGGRSASEPERTRRAANPNEPRRAGRPCQSDPWKERTQAVAKSERTRAVPRLTEIKGGAGLGNSIHAHERTQPAARSNEPRPKGTLTKSKRRPPNEPARLQPKCLVVPPGTHHRRAASGHGPRERSRRDELDANCA